MDPRHREIARCLFRESNDALFLFDPKDHHVVDVNPAALRLTRFDKDVACGMTLADLFAGTEPDGLDRLIGAYRRTGFYHSREGYTLRRESGEPIPVNVSVSRIHTTPDPLGLVVARDITERIKAQDALRESETRYRGLVESAVVLIWELSDRGEVRSLNPAFEAIVGDASRWAGRPFVELVDPEDRQAADAWFARTLRGGAPSPVSIRLVAEGAGRDPVEVEIISAARQVREGMATVSGIARDVSERLRAERAVREAEAMRVAKEAAEAADRAKSEFLGNISHELRTPLTAILGFTDVLLGDDRTPTLPPDFRDDLETIRQNGGHLLELINDILDLTKIEMGKLRVERVACSPAKVVRDVAASMRPRAEAKGISLVVDLAANLPPTFATDPVRFRQILINLLSNAIKFTAEGEVRVAADPGRDDGSGRSLRFAVVDTGVGITPAALANLFQPFYTSDRPTTRESGAGLGLAISRRLGEMLGGRIEVESRVGEGSTFTLTLPLGPADEPAPTAAADPANPTALARPMALPLPSATGSASPPARVNTGSEVEPIGGRILLVEDNESIRRLLALLLRQAGVEVVAASNGRQAVDLALAARGDGPPFDWVLMDMQMPVLDGYEATSQLRALGYDGPIIALTAYAIAEHRDECLRFGCNDHVSKPVDWPRLRDILVAYRGARHSRGAVTHPA